VTSKALVPAVIESAGPDAKRRIVEFFTANIRNPNTRESYLQAVRFFCQWCEDTRVQLNAVESTLVAAYIEEIRQRYSDGSVKVHLAAIRMLFDYFVTGGRESVRERLRNLVRVLLRRHKYPPDDAPAAIELVMKQAEALAEGWSNEEL